MRAVHFWGQESKYLPNQRVSFLWLVERGSEREKTASALGWNIDTQTITQVELIQTEGAALSIFHLCPSVSVPLTNVFLSFCSSITVSICASVLRSLYRLGFLSLPTLLLLPHSWYQNKDAIARFNIANLVFQNMSQLGCRSRWGMPWRCLLQGRLLRRLRGAAKVEEGAATLWVVLYGPANWACSWTKS